MVDIYPKVEVLGAGVKGYCKMILQWLNLTGRVIVPYVTGATGANASTFTVPANGTATGKFRFVTLSNIKGKIIPIPPYAKFTVHYHVGPSPKCYLEYIKVYLQKYEEGTWVNITGIELDVSIGLGCDKWAFAVALPSLTDEYEINNQLGLYVELTVRDVAGGYYKFYLDHTVGTDESYFMLPLQI